MNTHGYRPGELFWLVIEIDRALYCDRPNNRSRDGIEQRDYIIGGTSDSPVLG